MKLWHIASLDKAEALKIQNENKLPPIIATLLQIRGIRTQEEVQDFLYNVSDIADPLEIRDMEKAAERVRRAIEEGEKICVYGDYDADGVTSTALLYSYLEAVGADVSYYIPSREGEVYGMNIAAVDTLHEQGVQLIVTVDNGIAANAEIAHANSLGIDTVVTDHHTPVGDLPEAVAVVDLHRSDCPSRFKNLSGVGVAFKLVMALEGEYCDVDTLLDNYADLLSLGTIGDIVELRGENRVFVRRGLENIRNADRPGVSALVEASGLNDKPLTAGRISFTLVPRINAVGRLGSSGKSVGLLLCEDAEEARAIAREMSDNNNERREIETGIVDKIDEEIRQNPSLVRDRVVVIDGEGWHQGVIGIVASRVKEAFGKPAIILTRDGENAKGSGRSVEGFPLIDAISACSDLLTHFGGHPMAAGLSLKAENIELFRKRINEYAAGFRPMPYDRLDIDCKLNPAYITPDNVASLSGLQPYGAGNPTPVFGFYGMKIQNIIPLSNNKHLRLVMSRNNTPLTVMQFFTSTEEFPFIKGDVVDVAATLELTEYNGNRSVTVIAKEIKASDDESEHILNANRAFEEWMCGRPLSKSVLTRLLPRREDFAVLYRFLRANGGYALPPETLPHKLGGKLNYGRIRVIIEAMRELGLVSVSEGMNRFELTLCEVHGKVSLDEAPIIKGLKEAIQ